MESNVIDPQPPVQEVLKLITGMRNGTIQSYCVLTGKEALTMLTAISQVLAGLTYSMSSDTAKGDQKILQALHRQFQENFDVNIEIQNQLLRNAIAKPTTPEA